MYNYTLNIANIALKPFMPNNEMTIPYRPESNDSQRFRAHHPRLPSSSSSITRCVKARSA